MGSELGNALKAVKWGTDYLLKATAREGIIYVQVGDAFSDHNCWERPEDMDTLRTAYKIDVNHPGSDVAGETAAALAAASIVFRSRDPAYSRLLLNRAIKVSLYLFNFFWELMVLHGFFRLYIDCVNLAILVCVTKLIF